MPIRLRARGEGEGVRIENMSLIPNVMDLSKSTPKKIQSQGVSVSQVLPPPPTGDSSEKQKDGATEQLVEFLEKRKKKRSEKHEVSFKRYTEIISRFNSKLGEQRGKNLNIKG